MQVTHDRTESMIYYVAPWINHRILNESVFVDANLFVYYSDERGQDG